MKKLWTSLIFGLAILLNATKVFASDANFSDISSHWAKENIINFAIDGKVNGYSDGTFRPDNNVTKIEFIKMLVSSSNIDLVRSGDTMWPDFYIETAKENLLVASNEENFDEEINRYEMAKIIANFVDVSAISESKKSFSDLDKDYSKIVKKLANLGVISGYEDNTFRGKNKITRAESIVVIKKAVDAKKDLSLNKKYNLVKASNLSNYAGYEYKNNLGSNAKKVAESIVNENTYTAVRFVNAYAGTISQSVIICSNSKRKYENGVKNFSFAYFEDRNFDLARSSQNSEFSSDCYLEIEILKMWEDYSNFKNGIYVDQFKKSLLQKAMRSEFGVKCGDEILEYMLEKNIAYVKDSGNGIEECEVKKFGKYTINYYKQAGDVPKFYISK